MAGIHGWVLPDEWRAGLSAALPDSVVQYADLRAFGGLRQVRWILVLLAVAFFLPNSQTHVSSVARFVDRSLAAPARQRLAWAGLGAATVSIVVIAAINGSRGISEFIYFNF
jgi:hypothetical protein